MLSSVKRQDLVRDAAFVGGKKVSARNRIEVFNPANGAVLGSVPNLGGEHADAAIQAAYAALSSWRAYTAQERGQTLRRWQNAILANVEDLAAIITLEQGKPLAEARAEVASAAAYVGWFAEEARRVYGEIIPGHRADKRLFVHRAPVGVVAAVTPWNFPCAMIARKVAPALAVGCTMVLKPSELTPFSALALASLAEEAGVPAGVFNVITGDPAEIGDVLVAHDLVRKLTFTGSTAVGKMLAARCMSTVKRVTLELGGNAPFIVFPDADIETAADAAMLTKFRNAGQTCISTNRFLVHEAIYGAFEEALGDRISKISVGDGFSPATNMGPLINEAGLAKVERHLSDACGLGAKVSAGGRRADGKGAFFTPTLLRDVDRASLLCREETFGPLAALIPFTKDSDAVALANAGKAGLAAYVFTQDLSRSHRVTEQLDFGMVGLNSGMVTSEAAPFGGVKESGLGREGSFLGVDDYVDIKLVCVDVQAAE